jgi:hypothetical protein
MFRDLEAVSRLTSMREFVVHARGALDTLNDPRLMDVLDTLARAGTAGGALGAPPSFDRESTCSAKARAPHTLLR